MVGTNCDSSHDISETKKVSYCDFIDRSYSSYGGVFRVLCSGQLILYYCNFIRCSVPSTNWGGAICCYLISGNCHSEGIFVSSNFIECNAWERAQPRLLRAMQDLFLREPDKKWYVFVDDDSYVLARNLLQVLRYDETRKIVVGHFYCAWPNVVFGENHSMQCLPFPQGGAGIAVSHGLLQFISDKLIDCNNKYNSRAFAGSMRFGKCVNDYVQDNTWKYGDGIQNIKSQFNSRNPIDEIENGSCLRPPVTFHKLSPRQMKFVANGHITEMNEGYIDWADYVCRRFELHLDELQIIYLRFGLALAADEHIIALATSPILPINGSYIQSFEDSISILIKCDSEMKTGELEQDSVDFQNGLHFVIRLHCPDITVKR